MESQNYQNHKRFVPMYHYLLFTIVLVALGFSLIHLYSTICAASGRLLAGTIVLLSIGLTLSFFLFRGFALRAQDRAIRAEENLRYFAMTGKLLDKGLTMGQIIGLRFADDSEFVSLVEKALKEKLSNDAIKKEIKTWRADNHRA